MWLQSRSAIWNAMSREEKEEELLLESSIVVVNRIAASNGEYRRSVKRECFSLVRRIKLLLPFFEEVKESRKSLSRDAVDCFLQLHKTLDSAKDLLELCRGGSKLYLALEAEAISGKFQSLTEDLDRILDSMPFDSLDISVEVKEQVELMHQQLKRAKGRADTQDVELSMDILALSQKDDRNADIAVVERLADKLHLRTVSQLNAESRAVKKLIKEMGSEMSEIAQQMTYLLKKLKDVLQMDFLEDINVGLEKLNTRKLPSEKSDVPVPEDFLCPISLELMRDPVIVATGQTYERASIQKWLDSGHNTCPKTQQVLSHLTLTPNYVLRSLIAQWCEANQIQLPRKTSLRRLARASKSSDFSLEFPSGNRATIDVLIQNLCCQQVDVQRAAAAELRSLAKRNADNRLYIAEAGAVPHLIKLLYATDLKTQEHAVTALLNLSIHQNNKSVIVQEGAVQPMVEVLKHGSMEARENSAAALFSLSIKEENQVTIGASGAIPALVDLLRDGRQRGKKDAATALFNLCMDHDNKASAVRAGMVGVLLDLIRDERQDMVDEALAILALVATHKEGQSALGHETAIHCLVRLISSASVSPRNKENSAALLLSLASHDHTLVVFALQLGVFDHLLDLAQNGTTRARRKAKALLHLTRNTDLISNTKC